MKQLILLLVMMHFAVFAAPLFAGDYTTVTSTELKAMIDRAEPGLVIIDSRVPGQFIEAHIKGAISIPLEELEQNPALPLAPKSAKLVFYCSGTT